MFLNILYANYVDRLELYYTVHSYCVQVLKRTAVVVEKW